MKIKTWNLGQTLVELLVAIGLTMLLVPALVVGISTSRANRPQADQRVAAVALAREALDATRSVRGSSWNSFAVNGTYHPAVSGNNWTLEAGSENLNGFTREIEISDVYRATDSGNIVEGTQGLIDPSTKKVAVTVSWQNPIPATVRETSYLTRYLNNAIFTDTTQAQFNLGTNSGTTITNTSGGEVVLGAGGSGDWCSPNQSIVAQLDLPKNGVANALSAYEGRAIAGTGENASGVSLADITISNTDPPAPNIIGTADGYKTNDVFIDGTYAYIATDDNQKEIVIIDLNTYQEVGFFNAPGNADATSVYVVGNKGYATTGFSLYVFDLTSKTGSRPLLGSFLFLGLATSVVVNGNYAYVSLAFSPIEMQIIDISNPQQLSNTGWADVNATDGKKIFVNSSSTRAYLATGQDTNRREFFIINIASKNGSRPIIGGYDSSGMNPSGLSIVPGNKAILVGENGEEYQVIDITTETNPTRCGGFQVDTGIKSVVGILETDGDSYSYIVTGDASAEFKIIEGGPGGQFATDGTFESRIIDMGSNVAFNRFSSTINEPVTTDLRFQISTMLRNPQSGNCSGLNFTFLGPDGTSNTYYSTNSAIFMNSDGQGYENPGQCFRYKAFLTTSDPVLSPTLYDVTVNYSP